MNGGQLVLLLDPQPAERAQLTEFLHRQGYLPLAVEKPEELRRRCRREPPSAIILSNRLDAQEDGCLVCRQLKQDSITPVILLTDTDQELELYTCYASGADACLKRPISFPLLSARLQAMLRRSRFPLQTPVQLGDYTIQPQLHLFLYQGERISLTPREYDLLCYLVDHRNQALTRTQLLQAVWGPNYHGDVRTVDTHIKCLRKKLGNLGDSLVTLHRVGYKFEWKEEEN